MNLLNWQFHERNGCLTNYKLKKAKEDDQRENSARGF